MFELYGGAGLDLASTGRSKIAHQFASRVGILKETLPDLVDAGERRNRWIGVLVREVGLERHHEATRFEDAQHLAKHPHRIAHVNQQEATEHNIECLVGE